MIKVCAVAQLKLINKTYTIFYLPQTQFLIMSATANNTKLTRPCRCVVQNITGFFFITVYSITKCYKSVIPHLVFAK